MQKHEREGALDAKTNPLFCIRRGGPAGKNKTPFSHLKGGGLRMRKHPFRIERGGALDAKTNPLFASGGGGTADAKTSPFASERGGLRVQKQAPPSASGWWGLRVQNLQVESKRENQMI